MAFVTSSAQAEVGARWMAGGVNIETGKVGATPVKAAIENETASLLTTILGIPVKLLCKVGTLVGVSLENEGAVTKGGKVKFSGCAIYLEGSSTASTPCLPKTAGVNDIIETNRGKGLLVLFGGVGETLLTAEEEGKPLVVIESSTECAVGQKINITGEIILKDCGTGKVTEEKKVHLLEMDTVNSTLKAAGQKAIIDGSVNLETTTGLVWNGLPA
jgi:hypothetical protein